MTTDVVFTKIITPAIEEFNMSSPAANQVELNRDTRLIGDGSKINSLGLVSLIVAIEESAYNETKKQITIASEKAVARASSPFKTVGSLTDYVTELVNEQL